MKRWKNSKEKGSKSIPQTQMAYRAWVNTQLENANKAPSLGQPTWARLPEVAA